MYPLEQMFYKFKIGDVILHHAGALYPDKLLITDIIDDCYHVLVVSHNPNPNANALGRYGIIPVLYEHEFKLIKVI